MTDRYSAKDWDSTIQILLVDDLRDDRDEYERRVDEGTKVARAFLERQVYLEGSVPSVDTLKKAHSLCFGKVYQEEYAGKFRTDERGVEQVGRSSEVAKVFPGSFSGNIEAHLTKLTLDAKGLFAGAETTQEKAQAIGFFFAKFEAIHPFADGNGRLGRLVVQQQVVQELERAAPSVDASTSESYDLGFAKARESGDLAHLLACVADVELDEEHRSSPFPIEVWPQTIERDCGGGEVLRIENASVLEAIAPVHPDVARYMREFGPKGLALELRKREPEVGIFLDLHPQCARELEHEMEHDR